VRLQAPHQPSTMGCVINEVLVVEQKKGSCRGARPSLEQLAWTRFGVASILRQRSEESIILIFEFEFLKKEPPPYQ